jgi:NAD(P)-dependent dehydrogenase (short-subunit alcohol dehydrogenase family)
MTKKVAFVSGASGGLGVHVTKGLLDAGFAVVGVGPKISQAGFNHPDFVPLPAEINSGDAANCAGAFGGRVRWRPDHCAGG